MKKSKKFNIKNYSVKNQRKYKALLKAEKNYDIPKGSLKHFRNALKGIRHTLYGEAKNALRFGIPYRITESVESPASDLRLNAGLDGGVLEPINKKNDWLGIEIECVVDMKKVMGVLIDHDAREPEKSEAVGKFLENEKCLYFSVHVDPSVRKLQKIEKQDWQPIEVTVLCRIGNFGPLDKVCNALKKLGARVDHHCGLHVHIDARQFSTEPKIVRIGPESYNGGRDIEHTGSSDKDRAAIMERAGRLEKILPVLLAMNHPKRRTNAHCRPEMNHFGFDYKFHGQRWPHYPRYAAINVLSFEKHKTVEVRCHSGTTSADKIKHWACLLWAAWTCENWTPLVEMQPTTSGYNLHIITEAKLNLQLSENTWEYIAARIDLFSGDEKSIKRKNKVGVKFSDDDTEEVILHSMVDTEFHAALLQSVSNVTEDTPLADIVALENKLASEDTRNKLNTNWLTEYSDEIKNKMSAQKAESYFLIRRDIAVSDEFNKRMSETKSIDEINTVLNDAYARRNNFSSNHIEYMNDKSYKALEFRADVRRFELRKTKPVSSADIVDEMINWAGVSRTENNSYSQLLSDQMRSLHQINNEPFIVPSNYRGMNLEQLHIRRTDRIIRGLGTATVDRVIAEHPENNINAAVWPAHLAPMQNYYSQEYAGPSIDNSLDPVQTGQESAV